MRPQHVGCDQRVGQIDRRIRRQRPDQEFDQPHRARIGPQQIPVPVDRHRREWLLLRQHVVERAADFAEFGRGEVGLPPHRRKAGRDQQRVLLAQRHVEGGGKPHHHVAARRRPAQFHEAEMALRDRHAPGEIELRQAAAPAPLAQDRCEVLLPRHEYLPGSCANDDAGQHATGADGTTGRSGVGEWIGVAIALVSSCLGGTAAAITRYLVGNADPITLAILRWGIGFACLLPTALLARRALAAAPRLARRWRCSGSVSSDCSSSSIISRSALRPRPAPASRWRRCRSTPWWSGRCSGSSR